MSLILGNPLQEVGQHLKDASEARERLNLEIGELEREKDAITKIMEKVLCALVDKNEQLERMLHDRAVFDRAIGEMSHAFDTILNTSKTLVSVAHREQEGIERQKRQMDLVSQGVSLEEQMEMARLEEERALGANGGGAEYSDEDDEYYGGGGGGGGGGEGGRPQLRDPRQQQAQQQQQPRR